MRILRSLEPWPYWPSPRNRLSQALGFRWPFVLAERALARGARVASEALDPA